MKKIAIVLFVLSTTISFAHADGNCKYAIDLLSRVSADFGQTKLLASEEGATEAIKEYAKRELNRVEELKETAYQACKLEFANN